ncbi:Na+/H+ antiporter subunit D [Mesobacillus selenatarsenatis]|uniref:Na(+) H(+) antiporter subunit D n=1 Tax=Mesobacillus selenatarsenatis (strain DSM 18680 / JCM 14380 / FERM P-15431 / SF-1) TaxID=1321606 RepID=A0A0A8X6F0_MESS1|nr:Na+/H+ antiporter subunit D [Mesobacillus selenatarsenatis]GAM15545.1 Na(+) H(+) antiporter subunit D [Mesobacillus selenatarsenatis SF-1]
MNNLIILPILIPLITGVVLIFFTKNIMAQRWISAISALLTIIASFMLAHQVYRNGIQTMDLSNWEAPYGITLVSDMLSALLVLTTSIIAFAALFYSFKSIGEARERFFYYPVVNFLIVGVNGAFTTGDIFNLFVFFEVMLMSSYVLIVLGGTKIQLRESIKYILVNVISSALFVIAVAYLYSVVGTLNMAHISVRLSEIGSAGIITVIAVLFLIVFGLKGAIFPLYFWLPGSYYAPPAPVMALFGALLTKVGVYSITRTYTLFFYHDVGYTHQLLQTLAVMTIIAGVIGALAYTDIKKIIIYNIIVAVGVILFGVSILTPESLTGSIFYLIHDMNIKATLFLLIGIIIVITGTSDLEKISGLINRYPALGWTFFIATAALAGIPPLSGFAGKLMVVRSGFETENYIGAFVVLMSSLLVLFSVMRIFIRGFWGTPRAYKNEERAPVKWLLVAPAILTVFAVLYGFGTEAIYPVISTAAETLANPEIYINAVLKE